MQHARLQISNFNGSFYLTEFKTARFSCFHVEIPKYFSKENNFVGVDFLANILAGGTQ